MGLGHAYGRLGMTDKAMDCIHRLEQRQQQEPDVVVDGDLAGLERPAEALVGHGEPRSFEHTGRNLGRPDGTEQDRVEPAQLIEHGVGEHLTGR